MTSSSSLRRAPGPLDVFGRLTNRDRFLCRVLWEHRVLTTEQVVDLCFNHLVTAQHRLVALYRLGVLDRFRPLRPTGSESWRYSLGPMGAALVAAERGIEAPRPSVLRDRVVALAAGQRTSHTLGLNSFFCALHKAARERPGAAVGAWWSERRCAAEWGDFVRPDAYGIWEDDGRRVEFFLEHDTGSEPLARVAGKLAGYRDLAEAEGTARPVCFWLATPGREPTLRRALTENVFENGKPMGVHHNMLWWSFRPHTTCGPLPRSHGHSQTRSETTLPVATAVVGAGSPAGAVWLVAGEQAPRRRLAELTGRPAEARA